MAYSDAPTIEPAATAAPEVTPESAPAPKAGGLSDELLQLPVLQALFAGSPAAVSASIADFQERPEAKLILDHKDELMKTGVGLYRSLDGANGVLFNQRFIHGDDIKAADQAGKLLEVAPPFDVVSDSVMKSGEAHPALNPKQATGFAQASMPSTGSPPAAPVAPLPASAQRKVMADRLMNQQPGAPTSGPAPGAGRLLNNILKPVL